MWRFLYVPSILYLGVVFGLVAAGAYSGSHRYLFFFKDTATTEIYTLSLHDALPISLTPWLPLPAEAAAYAGLRLAAGERDRKSTRLNSSHGSISYAVFCLKKKKNKYLTFILNRRKKQKKGW